MNVALILAGGTGSRLGGDVPKQYIEVKNKPVIAYCLETINKNVYMDEIYIVADEMWHTYIIEHMNARKFKGFVCPGSTRQMSIWNGLCEMSTHLEDEDIIFIHDAARPMLTDDLISLCIESIEGHEGVIPILPVKDTAYVSDDGKRVTGLIDRSKLFLGQSPEAFKYGKYYKANEELLPNRILDINGSTEPAIMADMDIVTVDGEEKNFKITTKEDLVRFLEIINESVCT